MNQLPQQRALDNLAVIPHSAGAAGHAVAGTDLHVPSLLAGFDPDLLGDGAASSR
jgi:hypothetical protein